MRGHALAVLIVCSSCMTCVVGEPDPLDLAEPPDIEAELVYASELIEVFVPPEFDFCRGDGARMDAHIERLSVDLGVEPIEPLSIYVVGNDAGVDISNWCTGDDNPYMTGCFNPWIVMTQARSISHELNHAVLRGMNAGSGGDFRFWEEAYASAWETLHTTRSSTDLAAQDSGRSAGHFVRWLVDVHSIDVVRRFYVAIDPSWARARIDQEFLEVFGLTYDQAVLDFRAEAAPIYPGYGWCDAVEVIEIRSGVTQANLRVDCDVTDTYTLAYPAIDGMYVRRVLRLEQRLDLDIASSIEAGVLNHHPCLEDPVSSEDDPRLQGDNWNWNIGSGVPAMGMFRTIDNLEAGDHLFEFVVPMGEPVDLGLSVDALPPSG